jgi:hypothetical protein
MNQALDFPILIETYFYLRLECLLLKQSGKIFINKPGLEISICIYHLFILKIDYKSA